MSGAINVIGIFYMCFLYFVFRRTMLFLLFNVIKQRCKRDWETIRFFDL